MAVEWLSCRHAILAAALTLGGVVLHLRAREDGFRAGHLLSVLCYALGLCASEMALGALAYLYAYELLGRSEPLARRIRALLPSALLILGYLFLYKKLAYGVAGSAGYLDPLAAPAAFLRAAPARGLMLLGSFFGGIPADVASARPELIPLAIAVGLGLILLMGALLWAAWQPLDTAQRRTCKWLFAGAALSLIPSLGGQPGSRLLLVPSLGGVALLALLLDHSYRRAQAGTVLRRALLVLLVGLHVLRPPVVFTLLVAKLNQLAKLGSLMSHNPELPTAPQTAVVVLAASDALVSAFGASALQLETGRSLRAWWTLSMAQHDHEVSRLAADTLELAVKGGRMLDSPGEQLFRNPAQGFQAGDVIPLRGAEVRVLAERQGHPTRIAVKFDRPLDDPTLCFMTWRDGALRRVRIPSPGVVLHLPRTPGPTEE